MRAWQQTYLDSRASRDGTGSSQAVTLEAVGGAHQWGGT